jgi:hypothetical protein
VSRRAAALALAAAALAAGCSGPTAYEETLADWTREVETYEDFESRVFVRATLQVEPFRRAWARRYAELFELAGDQASRLAEAQSAEAAVRHVVFLAFFASRPEWDDLEPRRGLWNVMLEGPSGARVPASTVRRLDRRDPAWERLFPFVAHHDSLWEIAFDRSALDGTPIAGPGDEVALVIAGAPARLRLAWTLP